MRSECCCCRAVFAPRGTNDPWGGRLAAFCEDCALTRCDAFPGACRDGHGTPEALAPTLDAPFFGAGGGPGVVLPSEATCGDVAWISPAAPLPGSFVCHLPAGHEGRHESMHGPRARWDGETVETGWAADGGTMTEPRLPSEATERDVTDAERLASLRSDLWDHLVYDLEDDGTNRNGFTVETIPDDDLIEYVVDATHPVVSSPAAAERLEDALSGLRYIEQRYGRLDGVGWDRVLAVSSPVHHRERRLDAIRAEWVKDGVLCHFCGGPAFAWLTDDETWAQTESLLGSGQACAVCFLAARQVLGLSTGVPVRIVVSSPVQATGREERVAEALVRYDGVLAQAQAELVKRSDDDFYWEERVRDFVNVVRDLRKRHRRVLAFARTAAPSPDSGSSLAAVSVPPEAAECEDVSDLAESAQWALLEMRDRFSLERGQSVSLDALEDALRKSEGAGEEAGTETRPSQEGFGLHQPHPVQEKPGTGLPLSACHFGGDFLCEKPCAQHGECVHPDRARTSSAVPPKAPKGCCDCEPERRPVPGEDGDHHG